MLMRTHPFRELDRFTQQVFGTTARPAAMPMDAYRHGDSFYIHLDLPGVDADSIGLTVETKVLTGRAERRLPSRRQLLHPPGPARRRRGLDRPDRRAERAHRPRRPRPGEG